MSLLRTLFPNSRRRSRRAVRTGLVLCLLACSVRMPLVAQNEEGAAERKVVSRVEPKYPPTLERLYIGGVVRLQVEISANGNVENAQLIGGNPILGQAAIAAVKQWKYAPGSHKTKQTERLEFDPHR